MRKQSIAQWACARDGSSPLELTVLEESANEIIEGAFKCAQCQLIFPIHAGLPDFLYLESDHNAEIKRAEIHARNLDTDATKSVLAQYEARIETEAVLSRLRLRAQDRVLDVGCGYGRITRHLIQSGAEIVALDFSPARLNFLRAQVPAAQSVELAVADVNHLPLVPRSFTKILSTQVLEHLPTVELRRTFINRLFDLLAPGGTLVLTVYNYDLSRQRFGIAREGFHTSGIFYHCYDAAELAAEINSRGARQICGICHHLRGTYKLKLLPRLGLLGRWFDHTLEKIPAISLRYGSLLLAEIVKSA